MQLDVCNPPSNINMLFAAVTLLLINVRLEEGNDVVELAYRIECQAGELPNAITDVVPAVKLIIIMQIVFLFTSEGCIIVVLLLSKIGCGLR